MDYILLKAPMHVNWNYTYKCNFNCLHCYSRTRTDYEELSIEEKIRIAQNLIKSKVFNVNLGGGEPLLCDDCFEVIKYLSSHGVNVNLSTNGWKTSDATIKKLLDVGLSGVSISIDHIAYDIHDEVRNREGSFEEACTSIKKYVKAGIKVYISTTITAKNYEVLEKIVELGEKLGVYGIDFKRLKTMGNAYKRSDLEIDEKQVEKLYNDIVLWKRKYPIRINLVYGTERIEGVDAGCPCGKTSIAILCNGDISPCVYNTIVIGNMLRDDLSDIWCHSSFLKNFRKDFKCMGLLKENTSMYKICDNVIFQKDYRIDDNLSIADYVSNPNSEELDPDNAIAVVAMDGIPYELNMTGAIIVDEIISNKSTEQISKLISTIFDVSEEFAISSVENYINNLLKLNILEEVK